MDDATARSMTKGGCYDCVQDDKKVLSQARWPSPPPPVMLHAVAASRMDRFNQLLRTLDHYDSSASMHDLILGIEKHPPKSNDFKPVFIFLKNGEVVIKNDKKSSTIKILK